MSLMIENVSFQYPNGKEILKDISFSLLPQERVGLIAPSGYGKSTLANILAGNYQPGQGTVTCVVPGQEKSPYYPIQLIHQHPEKVFNPKWRMKKVLQELGKDFSAEIVEGLGIKTEWLNRYPHELSGGELQRFSVARVLATEANYLIADEISTMLDVVTQAEIWHFIMKFIEEREIGLLVMSHNPKLLEKICTRKLDLAEINHL